MRKFIVFVFVLLIATALSAQETTTEEMVTIPKSHLTVQQKAEVQQENIKSKVAQYGEWVGLGKEVGEAVNSSLGALTKQADDFSKTGVGRFTMFLIAWKVLGLSIIQFIVGVPLLITGLGIWIYSFVKNCTSKNVLDRVEADGTKFYKYVNAADGELMTGYFFFLIIYIIVCACVIFIH